MVRGAVEINSDKTVSSMKVGETKHIDMDEIFIKGNIIYIDKGTQTYNIPIDEKDEDDDDDLEENEFEFCCYIPIKRIGSGLTQDDFILDFTKFDAVLHPMSGIFWRIIEQSLDEYIQFSGFEIVGSDSKKEKTPKQKLVSLKNDLRLAEEQQDFEAAGRIKSQIDTLERQINQNK